MHKHYNDMGTVVPSVLAGLFVVMFGAVSQAASFTPGDVVVYRVGDGSTALAAGVGAPVFLDEYTTSGTLKQSVALPTSPSGSNEPLIGSGTAGTEGQLTRSADGQYLLLTGYDCILASCPSSLTSSAAATVPRTVGRVDFNGNIDTSTALTDFSDADKPRSAASDNGTNIWLTCGKNATGTTVGVHYTTLGSATSTELSTTITDSRQVNIFGGQLYVSAQDKSSGILLGSVGSGKPTTSPQTITGLITSTTDSGGKPEGFFMAALGGSAIDTAYVVDESLGIQKWSLVMGNWTLNNAIAQPASDQIYDIAGVVNGSSVTLYATGSTSNNDAGTLYSLSDTSGFNGSINGSLSLLVTASANKTFRGAALAPVSAATPTPSPTPTGFFNTPTRTPTIITPTPTLTPTKTLSPTRTPTGTKTPTAGPFTFGNVVAYRIGDGTATLVSGNGFPVFLDEYMISGSTATLKQSVPLPVTVKGSNQPLVASGTAGTEGQLTLSANGQYLMLTGYDAAVGTAGLNSSTSDVVARTVGRVDFNGIVNTTTALADFCSGDKPRSATSDGGTNIWLTCGANATGSSVGVHYATLGGTTSTQLSADIIDSRQVNIFGGQLYVSSQDSSGILFGTVGSGAPTSAGQSITALPGIDTTTDMAKNPDGFFMTALGGAGIDTLYVADTKDGIQKWSLVSGTWNLNNSVSASPDVLYGVTGTVNGTTVTLYATGSGSNNIEGTLYGLIDSSGFNGMMSGTLTSLATLPPNETFRGVALAPGAPTPGPSPTPPATPTKTASPTRTPTPAAFTAGNIVVYRVGNGSGALHRGVGFPVFLDEYTPGGTLVQSVGMPITDSGASHALIASASAGTEGQLTVSANGQYLLLTGYDAAVGAANLSSTTSDTVARTVGRVKYTGAVDTSTALTDFASGDKPRSAASDNGTNIWLSGGGKAIGTTGGIHYTTLGSTTSTQISSTYGDGRQVNVFGNQLYVSSQDTSIDFIGTVGSGLQTTGGQTMTPLPGFEMTGAPESFFMASLGGSGIDTLYVADDSAGIQKWSLVGGSWTLNNTIAPSADQLYGVAGSVSGTTVTLYATGSGSANTAGTL